MAPRNLIHFGEMQSANQLYTNCSWKVSDCWCPFWFPHSEPPEEGTPSPPGKHGQLPSSPLPPRVAVLLVFGESRMSAIHFSFPRQPRNSFLPRSQDRAGLAHKDFPSLQPSRFSAQCVSPTHHQKADLRGLRVARGACCTPLGVLLSTPSRSRCDPWERSGCQLSQGCSQGLWGRAEPAGMRKGLLGIAGDVLLLASPPCQTRAAVPFSMQVCVSSGHNLD